MRRYRLNSTPVERRRCPFAGVAELVDARDLGSRGESRGGSSPSARTTPDQRHLGEDQVQGIAAALAARTCRLSSWKSQKLSPTASSANSKSKCRPPISRHGSPSAWGNSRTGGNCA